MGKLNGLLQITGSFDGLSFYTVRGQIVVRKTGGFTGTAIKNGSQYVRVRENSCEFAQSARAGKAFRDRVGVPLKQLAIPYVHNRVVALFQALTRLDPVHARGSRTVMAGLQTAEGQQLVRSFAFDPAHGTAAVLLFACRVVVSLGLLECPAFDPSAFSPPPSASHVGVQLLLVGLGPSATGGAVREESDCPLYALGRPLAGVSPLVLRASVPDCPVVFGLLRVVYYQSVNGTLYRVAGGGLQITDVVVSG